MKFLQAILVAATLLLTFAARAADQYGVDVTPAPSGFIHANWTTNGTTPIKIEGSSVSNIPAAMALILPIPSSGFGVYLRSGGTNSSDTTNLTVTLEAVMFPSGTRTSGTQVVDNATLTLVTPTTASALPTGYDYCTNYSTYLTTASALLRADGIRVRSIQNTNLNSIWLTNFFQLR